MARARGREHVLSPSGAWASGAIVSTPQRPQHLHPRLPRRAAVPGIAAAPAVALRARRPVQPAGTRSGTPPAWRSSATGPGAGPSTGTPATSPATSSSRPRRATAAGRSRRRSTSRRRPAGCSLVCGRCRRPRSASCCADHDRDDHADQHDVLYAHERADRVPGGSTQPGGSGSEIAGSSTSGSPTTRGTTLRTIAARTTRATVVAREGACWALMLEIIGRAVSQRIGREYGLALIREDGPAVGSGILGARWHHVV